MCVCACAHWSLIGINEEDLDDDLKLAPAGLCDLIGGLGHHWGVEGGEQRGTSSVRYMSLTHQSHLTLTLSCRLD